MATAAAVIATAACAPLIALSELIRAAGSVVATPISLVAPEALSACGIHYVHVARAKAAAEQQKKKSQDYAQRFRI